MAKVVVVGTRKAIRKLPDRRPRRTLRHRRRVGRACGVSARVHRAHTRFPRRKAVAHPAAHGRQLWRPLFGRSWDGDADRETTPPVGR